MNKKMVTILMVIGLLIGTTAKLVTNHHDNEIEKEILSQTSLFSEYVNNLTMNGDPLALSPNPYDYIADNEFFNNIVDLGVEAVPEIERIVRNSKQDGLEEYMLVLAAQEILKVELHEVLDGKYNFIAPKEWCDKYLSFKEDIKLNVDKLLELNKIDELQKLGITAFPYLVDLYESGKMDLKQVLSGMMSEVKLSRDQKVMTTDYQVIAEEIQNLLELE